MLNFDDIPHDPKTGKPTFMGEMLALRQTLDAEYKDDPEAQWLWHLVLDNLYEAHLAEKQELVDRITSNLTKIGNGTL